MKKLLTTISTAFVVLLLNTFGLAIHASVMPMPSHEMNGMNHSTRNSADCATLCRLAVFNKKEVLSPVAEEKDDESALPFYAQNQDLRSVGTVIQEKLYADSVKPRPKIPIYILYSVFRV